MVRKGELACNKQISTFLTMFYTLYRTSSAFYMYFKLSSQNCFNLDQSNNLSSGNELTLRQTSPDFYVSAVKVF